MVVLLEKLKIALLIIMEGKLFILYYHTAVYAIVSRRFFQRC